VRGRVLVGVDAGVGGGDWVFLGRFQGARWKDCLSFVVLASYHFTPIHPKKHPPPHPPKGAPPSTSPWP